MCAINPRHQAHYVLSVYTSHPHMDKEEFERRVTKRLLEIEQALNSSPALRWHVKEDNMVASTHKVPSTYE